MSMDAVAAMGWSSSIPDEAVGTLLRGKIGMSRLRAAYAGATVRLPRDHGHLALLDGSYPYIRQFAPKVLETVRFKGGTEAKPPIEALEILRELNATGARNVPDNAPTLFVPTRWQGYLDEAAAKGDATAYRHYWRWTGTPASWTASPTPAANRPAPAAQKEFDRLLDRALHKPGVARDGLVLRHSARRAGLDRGVVHPGGDAARGEHRAGQLPSQTADDDHVRVRHAVVLGGQRFPTRGKSITARHLNKYFVSEGISTCTHVSDQHSTFGTKAIVATHREAHYVLDEILGNATDLPIIEHATDPHGVTLVNFGLFDLVGKQLSPRIRDRGHGRPRSRTVEQKPASGPLGGVEGESAQDDGAFGYRQVP
jgi:Tn3 transposase DDE domain